MATQLAVHDDRDADVLYRAIEFLVYLAGDDTPPTVANVDPAGGSVLHRGDPVAFDVLDETLLRRVVVLVEFPSGAYEVAHDGERFSATYIVGSTRAEVAGGFHFSLRRATGWPADPTIKVVAIDAGGNEDG